MEETYKVGDIVPNSDFSVEWSHVVDDIEVCYKTEPVLRGFSKDGTTVELPVLLNEIKRVMGLAKTTHQKKMVERCKEDLGGNSSMKKIEVVIRRLQGCALFPNYKVKQVGLRITKVIRKPASKETLESINRAKRMIEIAKERGMVA